MPVFNENVSVNGKLDTNKVGRAADGAIGGWRRVTKEGTGESGFQGGYRSDYLTKDSDPAGFDVGHVVISYCQTTDAQGQYESEWHVGVGPQDGTNPWSYFHTETNIGTFVDAGYSETINSNHATGGYLVGATVPSAFGPAGSSQNATFGFATAGIDPSDPRRAWYAQLYNGLLINPDSIAKGGRGVQINGANLPDNAPYAPSEVTRTWESGLRLERATFKDNAAMTLSPTQKIAKTDGTQALFTKTDGTIAVFLTQQQINKLKRLLA